MTASRYAGGQPPAATGTGLWRTVCRTARALRAIHREQVLMWELFRQVGRVPANPAQDGHARACRQPVRP
jgi:hypothetical protein